MTLLRRNPKNPNEPVIDASGYSEEGNWGYDEEIDEYSEIDEFGMIITYEVEDRKEWRRHKNKWQNTISQFADYLQEYESEKPNVMAESFFVTCREIMEEQIYGNSEMLKQMASHGVKIETIEIFYSV
tara:strand:+ start:35 stop:418 length:384 start_codon:yes stop_codon:yes gene_type:complete